MSKLSKENLIGVYPSVLDNDKLFNALGRTMADKLGIAYLNVDFAKIYNRIDELEAQMIILAHGGKDKEFYSVEETAQIWGMSKGALYAMIREGRLPAVKIGETLRISRATILKGTD